MVIIGIDPGTTRLGYGVVNYNNQQLEFVAAGLVPIKAGVSEEERLSQHRFQLRQLLDKYRPDASAVEILFFAKNTKTAIKVAQARGVILETLSSQGIAVHEFTPLQAKQAITGYGRATKEQIQRMVQLMLEMSDPPQPDDAADALALAICCAHSLR